MNRNEEPGNLRRWFAILGGLYALSVLGAYLVVPRLIAAAYAGRAWEVFNGLITGQDQIPLATYLDDWMRLVHVAAGAAGLLLVTLFGLVRYKKLSWASIRAWRPFSDDPPVPPPFGTLPLFAFSLGVSTGVLEFLAVQVREGLLGDPQWYYGPTSIWMTPLAHAGLFVAVSVICSAASRILPGLLKLQMLVLALVALASYVVVEVLFTNIHTAAAGLLGLGVGMRASGPIVRRSGSLQRWSTASSAVLCGALFTGWAGMAVWDRVDDSPPTGGPILASSENPNIILIVWDTVRAMSLSAYGFEQPTTPNLAELASRGVLFSRAIAPSSWTLSSHASMFTGRDPHDLSVHWEVPLDSTYPTIAEILSARGYATGGFAANPYYGTEFFGLARGFEHYEALPVTPLAVVQSAWPTRRAAQWVRSAFLYRRGWLRPGVSGRMMVRKGADRMNRDFLDWSAGAETPYFAFLNLYDAHDPYEPAVEFDRFGPGRTRNDPWIEPSGYSDLELDQERAAYHGAIAQLDHALGALVASLEARGDLENTVVIVTSDHGEEFAEHADVMGHGGSLYLPSVHVPLVMRWDAGIAGGSVVADPVSLRDLAPTILEFAGLTNTPFAGPSLASRWTDGANASADAFALSTVRYRKLPDAYPLTLGDLVSVSVGDFHYILNGDGSEELFDWRTDPFSTHDIAGDPAVESVLGRARRIACGQVSVGGCAEHPPHNESPTGTPK